MNNYPRMCLRGIPNLASCTDNKGELTEGVFRWHSLQTPNNKGWLELSINWEDDNTVVIFTLNQKKPNTNDLHFLGGVVRVDREILDGLKKVHPCVNVLDYERNGSLENPYHGNMLIHSKVQESNALRKAVTSQIFKAIVGKRISQP